jgi:hypothetical protein
VHQQQVVYIGAGLTAAAAAAAAAAVIAVGGCAGVLNHIQVSALFVRLTKLVSSKQLRPRDMLALPSLLPQVCLLKHSLLLMR